MELSVYQQTADYITRSRKILLALPAHVSVDRFCAAYALDAVLKKLGKETVIASAARYLPHADFLTEHPHIERSIASGQALVVHVSPVHAELDELSYRSDDEGVHIFLKPREGQFEPEDISVSAMAEPYDLVIVLGAQTLEQLEELYQSNPDVFFNTPKINIDIDPGNEYYGTINILEVTASSLCEAVTQVINSIESATTDEHVATSLLAGIIAGTHSFQDPATTPKTLTTASHLIAAGARQQDVIKSLYKTKDFSLLKLWGRALARIKTLDDESFLYTQLNSSDFERTGEGKDRIVAVMRELLENVTGFQMVALLAELDANVEIVLAGLPHTNIAAVAAKITDTAGGLFPIAGLYQGSVLKLEKTTLAEAEQKLLAAITAR
jgi:nanoRNase/pAp phosphatase (c-di-AMP/oligoRNAs hydrolase)